MTPTLWAAYHGNLEALALCCKRGYVLNEIKIFTDDVLVY